MYFCTKCGTQFGLHQAPYGNCPICRTISMYAIEDNDKERFTKKKNSDIMRKLKKLLMKKE